MKCIRLLPSAFMLLAFITSCATLDFPTTVSLDKTFEIATSEGYAAWSRAQTYVAKNSGYRIQTVSDYVISTYFTEDSIGRIAFTVTREIRGAKTIIYVKIDTVTRAGTQYLKPEIDNFEQFVTGKIKLDGAVAANKMQKKTEPVADISKLTPYERQLLDDYEKWEKEHKK